MLPSIQCALIACLLSGSLLAQSIEERLRDLESAHRAETQSLAERLAATERRNAELERRLGALAEHETRLELSALEERINAITASAQTANYVPATRSGTPIRFYGFLRFENLYFTQKANDPILAWRAARGAAEERDADNQFLIDPRLTRIGFDLDFGEIGSAKVRGNIETDFVNLTTPAQESRAELRIRLAFIAFQWDNFRLLVGQDWDVVAPLIPSVHGHFLLWGAGNLGDRRAQIQGAWESKDRTEQGLPSWIVKASLSASGTVDPIGDVDGGVPGPRGFVDGIDSGHPHGQLRIAKSYDTWVTKKSGTLGVWGYLAGFETDLEYNGQDRYTSYAVGFDWVQPISESITFRMEAWVGQALADMRGNILQKINTATGEEIGGYGGWAELAWQIDDVFTLVGGGSIDDVDNGDLQAVANQDRALNWTAFGLLRANWGNGLVTGFEATYFQTTFEDDEDGDFVRISLWIQLNF